jgi:hypothetical protein
MRYRKDNIISQVYSYNVISEVLYFSNNGVIESSNGLKLNLSEGRECIIEKLAERPFFNFHLYGFFYRNNDLIRINNAFGISGKYITIGNTDGFKNGRLNKTYNLYDIEKDNMLFRNHLDVGIRNINDYFFTYNFLSKELNRINNDSNTLWKFPLSQLGHQPHEQDKPDEIDKIIGVAHGNLWFTTKLYRIAALDVENGSLIFLNEGFSVFMNEISKNIYSIASNIIKIINTQSLVIEESYNFLQTDPKGIGKYARIYSPLLQGDYFTFLAEKEDDYGGIRHVGIFDYRKKELVWENEVISQEECNETKNQLLRPEPLRMGGNKLYIKDAKRNLHIFDRVGKI